MIKNSFTRYSLLWGQAKLLTFGFRHGILFNVYCFYRSPADQLQRYNDGSSQTKVGSHPKWRAFDIFIIDENGRPVWNDIEKYTKLGKEWVTYGESFIWGGNWRTLKDYNHFQVNALPMEKITSLQRVILSA